MGGSISNSNLLECGRCNIKRPTTASHCYECDVCIDEIDHYCPVRLIIFMNIYLYIKFIYLFIY